MLDPADCGPAFFALPQDVQAEAFDYPAAFFERRVHYIRRPGPDPRDVRAAAAVVAEAAVARAVLARWHQSIRLHGSSSS